MFATDSGTNACCMMTQVFSCMQLVHSLTWLGYWLSTPLPTEMNRLIDFNAIVWRSKAAMQVSCWLVCIPLLQEEVKRVSGCTSLA